MLLSLYDKRLHFYEVDKITLVKWRYRKSKYFRKFEKALSYATKNSQYSLLKSKGHEMYNPSFNVSILLMNRLQQET